MLAPRKKLWSTPAEAIQVAVTLLNIQHSDVVYDIGCGEGNFLKRVIEFAKESDMSVDLRGVEIEDERAEQARQELLGLVNDTNITVSVVTGNALEVDYSDGTCFFMYLIPRGLRLILPCLSALPRPIRVVTFMNPLPGVTPRKEVKVATSAHSEAQWPLFYYELEPTKA